MLRKMILISSVLFSTASFASFYEICEFTGTIENVSNVYKLDDTVGTAPLAILFKVSEANLIGGHTDCQGHVGRVFILDNSKHMTLPQVGAQLKVRYNHMNSLSPDGINQRTTFETLAE